jgi:uncharacterized iron-regulated membrane protein
MTPWLLRLHRWLALIFALPLIVVIATGLILSPEPWLTTATIAPGTLTAPKIEAWLQEHDPRGAARALIHRPYDHTLTLSAGRGGGTVIDTATGSPSAPSRLATLLGGARGLHERLMLDAEWLVIASSAAMLMLVLLGLLMGWPRIANTFPGWHKATAWGLLPLIFLSPATGLLMAAGVTFTALSPAATTQVPPAAPAPQAAPLTLRDAVAIVAREHDLSSLLWLRPQRGPRGEMLARLAQDGEYRVYAVTRAGTAPLPRNWPRLWHEGNFAGAWSAAMNLIISGAISLLLVTGLWIWLRRQLRRRAREPVGRISAAKAR